MDEWWNNDWQPFNFHTKIKKGVWLIDELLEDGGHCMTFDHFEIVYNIKHNFLKYQGLIYTKK